MENFKTAIILAGGKSSRMGFDKQFLQVRGRRLVDIIIEKLEEEFKEIIIVTNRPEEYKNYPYKILTDEIRNVGPLGGMYTGLKEARSKYSFIMACDMPNLSLDYIGYMKKLIEKHSVDVCTTKVGDYIEPFHSFYSKRVIEPMALHIGQGRRDIKSLVKNLSTYYVEEDIARGFSPKLEIFKNLNTQKDLKSYSKLT